MRNRTHLNKLMMVLLCMGLAPAVAVADVFLSVADNIDNVLGGLTFNDGDIVDYDRSTDTSSLFFSEGLITPNADIDAFHLLPNGHMVFSTLFGGRTIGGLTFDDGDLVEYDPVNDTASIYVLSESSFDTNADINAVHVKENGNILLSFLSLTTTFLGTTYSRGDLIEYNPGTNTAALALAEGTLFDDLAGNIDAVHLLPNGNYVFSSFDDEMISGVSFANGDLIEYDPLTDTASLFLSESLFSGPNAINIDAVYVVPEPGMVLLLCGGAIIGLGRRRVAARRAS